MGAFYHQTAIFTSPIRADPKFCRIPKAAEDGKDVISFKLVFPSVA